MHALYLVCLVGGLGATVLLALIGGLAGHVGGHTAGHLHVGHSTPHLAAPHAHAALPDAHGHAVAPVAPSAVTSPGSTMVSAFGWTLSWLSPLSIAAAVLWFGAGGMLADLAVPGISALIAVVAAVLGAGIVREVISAFARASSEPLSAGAVGAVGLLNARIQPGAMGEVVFDLEGLHRSAPARSNDGSPIPRGASVVIVRYEQGVAYVSALDPLSAINEFEQTGNGSEEVGSRRAGP